MEIQKYKQSVKELKRLSNIADKYNEDYNKREDEIRRKYWKLEEQLNKERYKEQDTIKKKLKGQERKTTEEAKSHQEIVEKYNRIMNFIEVNKKERDLNFKVYKCEDEQKIDCVTLHILKDDEFAIIKAFIVKNIKPKNKYSLVVVGKTIFNEDILKLPYEYGLPYYEDGASIGITIKCFPTEKEAREYYQIRFGKILQEFREQHREVEKEYKKVIAETNTKEWQITFLEHKKEYYENCVSEGTETKEYKQIIKDLARLKGGKNE